MARRIRYQDPNHFYLVTNRCFQARYLLRPDRACNEILRGCLARYAAVHAIELVCFVFMGNHFHLILRAPNRNLHLFMRDFQREIARRINMLRGRTGTMFPRRYAAEPILDDAAMQQKINYVLNNPVRANLVTHLEHWPGVSSWDAHKSGKPIVGHFFDASLWAKLRQENAHASRAQAMKKCTIDLVLPDFLKRLGNDEGQEKLLKSVESRRLHLRKHECSKLFRVAGARRVLRKHWSDKPSKPANSPQPICHSSCPELRRQYIDGLSRITARYRQALQRFQEGHSNVTFPEGTIPPGWTTCICADVHLQSYSSHNLNSTPSVKREKHELFTNYVV